MKKNEIERIEINLFLEAIYQRYGFDFRSYSRASIKRRVLHAMNLGDFKNISDMISYILYNEAYFKRMINHFSISVTEMFRNPNFYKELRQEVIPYLKTFPFIKIWHAGCSTGEEVYSMAILLKEEGIYDRTTIFATDFNDSSLHTAKDAIYSLSDVKNYTENYQKSGGKYSFSDYYYAKYDSAIIDYSLKKRITFANHNLVTDGVFGEMHLIFCRNVLIYFNNDLQNKVLGLFKNSLVRNGFLCLGNKESLYHSGYQNDFNEFSKEERIYQKKH